MRYERKEIKGQNSRNSWNNGNGREMGKVVVETSKMEKEFLRFPQIIQCVLFFPWSNFLSYLTIASQDSLYKTAKKELVLGALIDGSSDGRSNGQTF